MKSVNVDIASMHPSPEIAMTIETVIKSVCEKCKFYDESFGVCSGEILPVERAILNNAEGRGLCDIVKNFIAKEEEED